MSKLKTWGGGKIGRYKGSDEAWKFDERQKDLADKNLEVFRKQWLRMSSDQGPFAKKMQQAEIQGIVQEQQATEQYNLTKEQEAEKFDMFREQSTSQFQQQQSEAGLQIEQQREMLGEQSMQGMVQEGKSGFAGGSFDPRKAMANKMKQITDTTSLGMKGAEQDLQQNIRSQQLQSIQTMESSNLQMNQSLQADRLKLEAEKSDIKMQQKTQLDDIAAAMQSLISSTSNNLTNPHQEYNAPTSPGQEGSATDPNIPTIIDSIGGG